MRFNKRKEKETVVSISEVTTISSVYYDIDGNELKMSTLRGNSGLTYAKIGYKKFKNYKVDSIKYYNDGGTSSLISASFETREEAEEMYNNLLNLNGKTYIENIIDKKTFVK